MSEHSPEADRIDDGDDAPGQPSSEEDGTL